LLLHPAAVEEFQQHCQDEERDGDFHVVHGREYERERRQWPATMANAR
jgi:hypothetical protein